jgi:hypothetical protein
MNKELWEHIKSLGPSLFPVILPPKVAHPGAVHGPKIGKRRHAFKTGPKSRSPLTNHERIILRRAARMNISVAEYKRRFCL